MPHNYDWADIAALNQYYEAQPLNVLLHDVFVAQRFGEMALVSSFGAESVVLLHQVSLFKASAPVLFLNTEMLFPETLDYQRTLAMDLGLSNVQVIVPDADQIAAKDPLNSLHKLDTDACCDLRKTKPLQAALKPYDGWITGRKRHQNKDRAELPFFEVSDGKLKINPMKEWGTDRLKTYIEAHDLPRHPLVAAGYPSIGCAVCTTQVKAGEDPRAGRWRGQEKTECGIHFENGRMVPMSATIEENDMSIIVTDTGFRTANWPTDIVPFEATTKEDASVEITTEFDAGELATLAGAKPEFIQINIPSAADGRGFTLARRLRLLGFEGRLRASGHVLSDQYAMARRSGFDEVEISDEIAERQPEAEWLFRANWQDLDYGAELRR